MTAYLIIAVALMILALPVGVAMWLADFAKGLMLNKADRCASCGQALDTPTEEQFLIQGRFNCASCSARMRKQLPFQMAFLGVAGAVLAVAGASAAVDLLGIGARGWFLGVLTPSGFAASIGGAIELMKWMNRRTLKKYRSPELLLTDGE